MWIKIMVAVTIKVENLKNIACVRALFKETTYRHALKLTFFPSCD